MARKRIVELGRGLEEGGPLEPGMPGSRGRGKRKVYSVEGKLEALRDFETSGLSVREFCERWGYNTASLCRWRKQYRESGASGLEAKPNPRNTSRAATWPVAKWPGGTRRQRVVPPEERRALIEAYRELKLPQEVFAKSYGISSATLRKWLKRYEAEGPKGLEPLPRGRKGGAGGRPSLPKGLRDEIVATKRRFPTFGLRKVRDYLKRFLGLKVSTGGVRSTLRRAGIAPLEVKKKRRRSSDRVRRFERSRPMELWQTDITSFVLRRSGRRVFLTVFLDDNSRYVVSYGLSHRATGDLVSEALLSGIERFSKPREVLTDQGRQYFAWRGKTSFQKLLVREGISHVVSRAHHPETLGKCERLWETISREFWERAKPADLEDAEQRLRHYFQHYNHFRPHQGLSGLVPADRFFGQQEELRETLERHMTEQELRLALEEPVRKPVFLIGQIGDKKVSLHGERGRIQIQTEDGLLEEMSLEEAGNDGGPHEDDDADDDDGDDDGDDDSTRPADAEAEVPPAAAAGDPGAGSPAGGDGGRAPEGAGRVLDDPGAVAREDGEERGGEAARGGALAGVAAVAAGAVGDDRGAADAAADEAAGGAGDGGDEPLGPAGGSGPEGADAGEPPAEGRSAGVPAGECSVEGLPGPGPGGGGGPWTEEVDRPEREAADEGGEWRPRSDGGSGRSCSEDASGEASGESWRGRSP